MFSHSTDAVARGTVGLLRYGVWGSPQALARHSAADIASEIISRLSAKDDIRIVFAAAPSQQGTLSLLKDDPRIDWSRIHALHMDEYVGLAAGAPERFGVWLGDHLFDHVPMGTVSLLDPRATDDPDAEARRYGELLTKKPIDIVLAGVGVNGHVAFNDPPAHFAEPLPVRVVALSQASRQQQVTEGLFASLGDVPTHAWTVSIPVLMSAQAVFCMAPGGLKSDAVTNMLTGPVTGEHPASVLRNHPHAALYLDTRSGRGLL
ncbi:MAG TPA: 6-phosphogluconolactonase [Microbacteriaceae bacterium]|nr:6-phosphogluconolactonase [Microbacteriaceae bacterium]